MNTLGLLCSGGDAPGMNMALWAAARSAEARGWRVLGVHGGYQGLLGGSVEPWPADRLRPFARLGGAVLGTSRVPDFTRQVGAAAAQARSAGITHALVLGGDGSLRGAGLLNRAGLPTVGLPATIDNDVPGSAATVGFDSAVNFALPLADALLDTAEALPRLCALETLGGNTGHLAQAVGDACGADVVLVPEAPLAAPELAGRVSAALARRRHALIVASEGYPALEGVLDALAREVGLRLRLTRLGHAQRGGRPSARDRLLAGALAGEAADLLARGHAGVLAWRGAPTLLEFAAPAQQEA
ncbi:6-phosphofructokinase [Deinococcus koreensis]|uniref:6-phosphofructokinase n=1 Tax=Deinococcus koreensis TaxID=2054903 RepID=A0A2K3UT38_9DEIO|nr:6-phosphofructokinase [Deinococcus koreensis]PNY79702.1 phosphofructokinase [Deinococcus koreensis]